MFLCSKGICRHLIECEDGRKLCDREGKDIGDETYYGPCDHERIVDQNGTRYDTCHLGEMYCKDCYRYVYCEET